METCTEWLGWTWPSNIQWVAKSLSNVGSWRSEHLERAIHAGGRDEGGVLTEAHAGRQRRVVVENLQLLPLLAQVHSEIQAQMVGIGTTKLASEAASTALTWHPCRQPRGTFRSGRSTGPSPRSGHPARCSWSSSASANPTASRRRRRQRSPGSNLNIPSKRMRL